MTVKHSLRLTASRLLMVMLVLGLMTEAGAAAKVNDALALSVTPLVRELTANPGETVTGTIDITNPSPSTQDYAPLTRDFAPNTDPTKAYPQFFETTPDSYQFALSKWLTFSQDKLTVAPAETRQLGYTIKIPANAEPGGHYAAVFAINSTLAAPSGGTATQVAISARVGSLILLTVSGKLSAQPSLTRFTPTQRVYERPPVTLQTLIQNVGNVHVRPSGTIDLKDWRGRLSSQLTFNTEHGVVLPNSSRQFTTSVSSLAWGRYSAVAALTADLPSGEKIPLTASTIFYVLPLKLMLIILASLILVLLLFRWWLRRHDQRLRAQRR